MLCMLLVPSPPCFVRQCHCFSVSTEPILPCKFIERYELNIDHLDERTGELRACTWLRERQVGCSTLVTFSHFGTGQGKVLTIIALLDSTYLLR